MNQEIENYGRQRLLTAKIWAALLLIIFCMQIEVAVAQNEDPAVAARHPIEHVHVK